MVLIVRHEEMLNIKPLYIFSAKIDWIVFLIL